MKIRKTNDRGGVVTDSGKFDERGNYVGSRPAPRRSQRRGRPKRSEAVEESAATVTNEASITEVDTES